MWNDLLVGLALALVVVGVVPFLVPERTRRAMRALGRLGDGPLRFVGLTSMVIGCLLLYVVR